MQQHSHRGASQNRENRGRRYCIACKRVYETAAPKSTLCPECQNKADLKTRRESKREKDTQNRREQSYNARFVAAEYQVVYDPDHLYSAASVLPAHEVISDMRFGSFTPGTILYSQIDHHHYQIRGSVGSRQSIIPVIAPFYIQKVRVNRTKYQINLGYIKKPIVILYETGYNVFNTILEPGVV